jgi:hypothetical protein
MAPPAFDTWLDREQAKMLPSDYLAEAPGVAIAGDAILRAIGYRPGSQRPPGWFKRNTGVFRYLRRFKTNAGLFAYAAHMDGMILQVRQCENEKLWVIERFRAGDWLDPAGRLGLNIYALVCTQTGRLIWAPTYQAAMRLANYCHPIPQPPIVGRWAQVYEQKHAEYVAEYERERAMRQRVVARRGGGL